MTPSYLFLYILCAGLGLFVCWLLTLVGAFLLIIGKGWLTELAKDSEERPKRKARKPLFQNLAIAWAVFVICCFFIFLGTKL